MKKYVFFALAAGSMICSCNKEETVENDYSAAKNPITFVANADNSGTKTYLDGNGSTVNWSMLDKVTIYGVNSEEDRQDGIYETQGGGATSVFYHCEGWEFGEGDRPQYAIYPSSVAQFFSDEGEIEFSISEFQNLSENSFGEDSNVAVGKVSHTTVEGIQEIHFKNVFGYLRLKLSDKTKSTKLDKIVLTTKGEECLWGDFIVNLTEDKPEASYESSGSQSITLRGAGELLDLTEEPTAFYFVLPVGALSSGFTVKLFLVNGDGDFTKQIETNKDMTINRNSVKAMKNIDVSEL